MQGFINIKVSEHGIGIDCDLEEVSPQNKLELMHSLAAALQMDDHEMTLYILVEQAGAFCDVSTVTRCETTEELQAMLDGDKEVNT